MSSGNPADHRKIPALDDAFLKATIMAATPSPPVPAPAPAIAVPIPRMLVLPKPGDLIRHPIYTGRTYKISHLIGRGAFGNVYAAKDNWGRDVAVKVFRGEGTYEEIRDRAHSEAIKLRSLTHPRITYIYDAFEQNNTFYIVSERCGLVVSDFLDPKHDGVLWVRPLGRCLFQALGYIHENGFAHQDIHLDNVFAHFAQSEMVADSTVISFKVGDLGLAKPIHLMDPKTTVLAQWILPPEAMDPETFGPLDHRLDLYHAALLLLQVHIGRKLELTREDILSGVPRLIAEGEGAVGQVLSHGLRRHVLARPSSALEFWEALEKVAP
jgi:serine/threonine protein kinase